MISRFPAAIVTRGRNQRHLPIWVKIGSAFAGTSLYESLHRTGARNHLFSSCRLLCDTVASIFFFFEIQWLQFVEEEAGGLLKNHDSEVGGCGRVYS
jgi:hypothetical protein